MLFLCTRDNKHFESLELLQFLLLSSQDLRLIVSRVCESEEASIGLHDRCELQAFCPLSTITVMNQGATI